MWAAVLGPRGKGWREALANSKAGSEAFSPAAPEDQNAANNQWAEKQLFVQWSLRWDPRSGQGLDGSLVRDPEAEDLDKPGPNSWPTQTVS